MLKMDLEPQHTKWDEYKASHVAVAKHGQVAKGYNTSPLILFDTGELICIRAMPEPGERGYYRHLNVELGITTDNKGPALLMPDGAEIKRAWFPKSYWFMADHCTDRVVRIDEVQMRRGMSGWERHQRPYVPRRFHGVQGYIGGEGCYPIGTGAFVLRPTIQAWATPEQKEHIKALESACRATMKLTDDKRMDDNATCGIPFEMALQCQEIGDVPDSKWHQLFHKGVERPMLTFDYLRIAK